MSLQLLNEISNNYQMAVAVHRELADTFWFIYMPGYAMWNEYQLIEELCTQRKIKRYITSTYHTFVLDKLPTKANITEPLLSGKNRKSLRAEDSYKIIRELFRIYLDWEEAALQKYQQIAAEILANGEASVFNFIGEEILKPVKAELVYIQDKNIELAAHDFDMPQIVGEQADYFERFEYLIKTMFGKSEMFHHWNSNLDAESRTSVF